MEQAAQILIGEHDFSAFRAANCSSPSPLKNIREILISKKRFRYSTLQIEFEANSFLQHMVRIITGTLVEVGQGRKSVDEVAEALESGQRELAGITAKPHGLYSLEVIYPQGMIEWPKEVIDN
jgi:tRNA pseudouridine38-40 synthase